jgi:hypothetical protein
LWWYNADAKVDGHEEAVMKWQQFITGVFERISQELERILNGLTVDDLNKQPNNDCNSIGWLAWHLTRSQDRCNQALFEEEQIWIKDKWYSKFNRAADPRDSGFNHGTEDLTAFKSPDSEILIGYHSAVLKQSKHYIVSQLTESDLDRDLNNPKIPRMPTVSTRLVAVINDNLQHIGQMAYVRGLLKGKGWSDR